MPNLIRQMRQSYPQTPSFQLSRPSTPPNLDSPATCRAPTAERGLVAIEHSNAFYTPFLSFWSGKSATGKCRTTIVPRPSSLVMLTRPPISSIIRLTR